ncbi:MAG TPA: hypothetical protein VMW70_09995 [Burkholderiales bacterium]|nr:hypothetical protein [Burkholderiales bacterium]
MTDKKAEESKLKTRLEEELVTWQTRIDEARLQMNLGSRDARDNIQSHLEELEREFQEAKQQWGELESASASAWNDISHGLKLSFDSMKDAFAKAKQHFPKDGEK